MQELSLLFVVYQQTWYKNGYNRLDYNAQDGQDLISQFTKMTFLLVSHGEYQMDDN